MDSDEVKAGPSRGFSADRAGSSRSSYPGHHMDIVPPARPRDEESDSEFGVRRSISCEQLTTWNAQLYEKGFVKCPLPNCGLVFHGASQIQNHYVSCTGHCEGGVVDASPHPSSDSGSSEVARTTAGLDTVRNTSVPFGTAEADQGGGDFHSYGQRTESKPCLPRKMLNMEQLERQWSQSLAESGSAVCPVDGCHRSFSSLGNITHHFRECSDVFAHDNKIRCEEKFGTSYMPKDHIHYAHQDQKVRVHDLESSVSDYNVKKLELKDRENLQRGRVPGAQQGFHPVHMKNEIIIPQSNTIDNDWNQHEASPEVCSSAAGLDKSSECCASQHQVSRAQCNVPVSQNFPRVLLAGPSAHNLSTGIRSFHSTPKQTRVLEYKGIPGTIFRVENPPPFHQLQDRSLGEAVIPSVFPRRSEEGSRASSLPGESDIYHRNENFREPNTSENPYCRPVPHGLPKRQLMTKIHCDSLSPSFKDGHSMKRMYVEEGHCRSTCDSHTKWKYPKVSYKSGYTSDESDEGSQSHQKYKPRSLQVSSSRTHPRSRMKTTIFPPGGRPMCREEAYTEHTRQTSPCSGRFMKEAMPHFKSPNVIGEPSHYECRKKRTIVPECAWEEEDGFLTMPVRLKKRQLAERAQQLLRVEEAVKQQELEAQERTWHALQQQELALKEKEESLKQREAAAQRKLEQAARLIEESRKHGDSKKFKEDKNFASSRPVSSHSLGLNRTSSVDREHENQPSTSTVSTDGAKWTNNSMEMHGQPYQEASENKPVRSFVISHDFNQGRPGSLHERKLSESSYGHIAKGVHKHVDDGHQVKVDDQSLERGYEISDSEKQLKFTDASSSGSNSYRKKPLYPWEVESMSRVEPSKVVRTYSRTKRRRIMTETSQTIVSSYVHTEDALPPRAHSVAPLSESSFCDGKGNEETVVNEGATVTITPLAASDRPPRPFSAMPNLQPSAAFVYSEKSADPATYKSPSVCLNPNPPVSLTIMMESQSKDSSSVMVTGRNNQAENRLNDQDLQKPLSKIMNIKPEPLVGSKGEKMANEKILGQVQHFNPPEEDTFKTVIRVEGESTSSKDANALNLKLKSDCIPSQNAKSAITSKCILTPKKNFNQHKMCKGRRLTMTTLAQVSIPGKDCKSLIANDDESSFESSLSYSLPQNCRPSPSSFEMSPASSDHASQHPQVLSVPIQESSSHNLTLPTSNQAIVAHQKASSLSQQMSLIHRNSQVHKNLMTGSQSSSAHNTLPTNCQTSGLYNEISKAQSQTSLIHQTLPPTSALKQVPCQLSPSHQQPLLSPHQIMPSSHLHFDGAPNHSPASHRASLTLYQTLPRETTTSISQRDLPEENQLLPSSEDSTPHQPHHILRETHPQSRISKQTSVTYCNQISSPHYAQLIVHKEATDAESSVLLSQGSNVSPQIMSPVYSMHSRSQLHEQPIALNTTKGVSQTEHHVAKFAKTSTSSNVNEEGNSPPSAISSETSNEIMSVSKASYQCFPTNEEMDKKPDTGQSHTDCHGRPLNAEKKSVLDSQGMVTHHQGVKEAKELQVVSSIVPPSTSEILGEFDPVTGTFITSNPVFVQSILRKSFNIPSESRADVEFSQSGFMWNTSSFGSTAVKQVNVQIQTDGSEALDQEAAALSSNQEVKCTNPGNNSEYILPCDIPPEEMQQAEGNHLACEYYSDMSDPSVPSSPVFEDSSQCMNDESNEFAGPELKFESNPEHLTKQEISSPAKETQRENNVVVTVAKRETIDEGRECESSEMRSNENSVMDENYTNEDGDCVENSMITADAGIYVEGGNTRDLEVIHDYNKNNETDFRENVFDSLMMRRNGTNKDISNMSGNDVDCLRDVSAEGYDATYVNEHISPEPQVDTVNEACESRNLECSSASLVKNGDDNAYGHTFDSSGNAESGDITQESDPERNGEISDANIVERESHPESSESAHEASVTESTSESNPVIMCEGFEVPEGVQKDNNAEQLNSGKSTLAEDPLSFERAVENARSPRQMKRGRGRRGRGQRERVWWSGRRRMTRANAGIFAKMTSDSESEPLRLDSHQVVADVHRPDQSNCIMKDSEAPLRSFQANSNMKGCKEKKKSIRTDVAYDTPMDREEITNMTSKSHLTMTVDPPPPPLPLPPSSPPPLPLHPSSPPPALPPPENIEGSERIQDCSDEAMHIGPSVPPSPNKDVDNSHSSKRDSVTSGKDPELQHQEHLESRDAPVSEEPKVAVVSRGGRKIKPKGWGDFVTDVAHPHRTSGPKSPVKLPRVSRKFARSRKNYRGARNGNLNKNVCRENDYQEFSVPSETVNSNEIFSDSDTVSTIRNVNDETQSNDVTTLSQASKVMEHQQDDVKRKLAIENDTNSVSVGKTVEITCGKCNIVYKTSAQFNYHVQSEHNGLARPLGESQEFTDQETHRCLSSALKTIKKLRCSMCAKQFKSVAGYKGHIELCSLPKEDLNVSCRICCRQIRYYYLDLHMKKNHEMREFKKSDDSEPGTEDSKSGTSERRRPQRKAAANCDARLKVWHSGKEPDGNGDLLIDDDDDDFSKEINLDKFYVKSQKNSVSKEALLKMEAEFTVSGTVKCTYEGCSQTFTDLAKGLGHLPKCKVGMIRPYRCKLCSFTGSKKEEMFSHLTVEHNDEIAGLDGVESSDEECKFALQKVSSRHCMRPGLNIKPFAEAMSWTMDYLKQNESQTLFEQFCVTQDDWILLNEELASKFMPSVKRSPNFTITSVANEVKENAKFEWHNVDLFQGTTEYDGCAMFCGGPIITSSWCPQPVLSAAAESTNQQYLALSTVPTPDEEYPVVKSVVHKGLIQIWSYVCSEKEGTSPEFLFGIAHNFGNVWSLAWCPSGAYDNFSSDSNSQEKLKRLGLLAAACSDGTVRIFVIPHPSQLEYQNSNRIFMVQPKITLSPGKLYQNEAQCLKVDWFQGKGHSDIAGALSTGVVCIWDIENISPLLCVTSVPGRITMYPIRSFGAHNGACTTLAFCPTTEGRNLVTGGNDRTYKFWDLENTDMPLNISRKGLVLDILWPLHWAGSFVSFDDVYGLTNTNTCYRENGYFGIQSRNVLSSNAPVRAISYSNWMNAVAQGDSAGQVVITLQHQLFKDYENEKFPSKRKVPLLSSRLVNLKQNVLVSFHQNKYKMEETLDPKSSSSNVSKSHKKKSHPRSGEKYAMEDEGMCPASIVEWPRTYNGIQEEYGIVFRDVNCNSLSRIPEEEYVTCRRSDTMEPGPVVCYPMMSITSLAWNNNLTAMSRLFIGTQSGLARIVNIKSLNTEREKKFVRNTVGRHSKS